MTFKLNFVTCTVETRFGRERRLHIVEQYLFILANSYLHFIFLFSSVFFKILLNCSATVQTVGNNRLLCAGIWTLEVEAEGVHTLRVTGLSTLDFQARFSRTPSFNFAEAEYQPVAGEKRSLLGLQQIWPRWSSPPLLPSRPLFSSGFRQQFPIVCVKSCVFLCKHQISGRLTSPVPFFFSRSTSGQVATVTNLFLQPNVVNVPIPTGCKPLNNRYQE